MNEQVKFARWVLIHTDEAKHTAGVCRRYQNKLYTIDEIFDIYTNIQSKSENAELTPYIGYDRNGNVLVKGQKNSVKEREGLWEWFYPNGNIKWRIPYKEGKMDGIAEVFYENGNISMRTPYKEGKIDGIDEGFYPNGNIQNRIPYKEGKRNGIVEWFYPNGNIHWRISYKDDRKDGIEEWFDERGTSQKPVIGMTEN